MLAIKLVLDGIKKSIRNYKNRLKKNFQNTYFLPKTEQKSKINQNAKRETK